MAESILEYMDNQSGVIQFGDSYELSMSPPRTGEKSKWFSVLDFSGEGIDIFLAALDRYPNHHLYYTYGDLSISKSNNLKLDWGNVTPANKHIVMKAFERVKLNWAITRFTKETPYFKNVSYCDKVGCPSVCIYDSHLYYIKEVEDTWHLDWMKEVTYLYLPIPGIQPMESFWDRVMDPQVSVKHRIARHTPHFIGQDPPPIWLDISRFADDENDEKSMDYPNISGLYIYSEHQIKNGEIWLDANISIGKVLLDTLKKMPRPYTVLSNRGITNVNRIRFEDEGELGMFFEDYMEGRPLSLRKYPSAFKHLDIVVDNKCVLVFRSDWGLWMIENNVDNPPLIFTLGNSTTTTTFPTLPREILTFSGFFTYYMFLLWMVKESRMSMDTLRTLRGYF